METSLHRDLKELYASKKARIEVPVEGYRIDVVDRNRLIEIQHGSLAAIRDKVGKLLKSHSVLVVKPIVVRKKLVKLASKGGKVIGQRMSPKRGTTIDLFGELVYFTKVFPHRKLSIEVPLVDIEELRYPGHGRRRRRRINDHQVEDQRLLKVYGTYRLRTAGDLVDLVSCPLPTPFHTGNLAESLNVDRWIAQRIAYCLRKMGAICQVGKRGNALLYEFPISVARRAKRWQNSSAKPLKPLLSA